MPVHQTPTQKAIVARVMGEFKEGELAKRDGEPVTDPKQAIAIALHEAGASDRETPQTNRRNLRRTRAREASGTAGGRNEPTRAELYAEAKRRDIAGRSSMSKGELAEALRG